MRTAYFILPAVILCLLSCAAPVSPADSPIPSGVREVELGIQALEGGMWEEAYQHISSAREAYLSMPTPFWNWEHTRLLGVAAFKSGRGKEGEALLIEACEQDPSTCPELSVLYKQQGRLVDAIPVLEGALARAPTSAPRLWLALGVVHTTGGDFRRAALVYRTALRVFPHERMLRVNRCQAVASAYGDRAALPLLVSAHRAEPAEIKTLLLLVKTYMAQDRPADVAESLNRALAIDPRNKEAREMKAKVLQKIRQYEEALHVLRELSTEEPHNLQATCRLVRLAQSVASWEDFEPRIAPMMKALRASHWSELKDCLQPLEAAMNPMFSQEDLQWVTRQWADKIVYAIHGASYLASKIGPLPPAALSTKAESSKMRIGYLSSNLQGGAVWLMIQGMWRGHARLRGEEAGGGGCLGRACAERRARGRGAHVMTYSTLAIDPGGRGYGELAGFTHVRELQYPGDLVGSAQVMRGDALNVLINVNGWCDSGANDVLTARVAPLQVSYMGYPGSMGGGGWSDYLITDSIASPTDYQMHYGEKLLYMPRSYYINDFRRVLPGIGSGEEVIRGGGGGRAGWGLPEGKFVFVCFSRAEKIDRGIATAWMNILKRTPGSVIWLLRDLGKGGQARTIVSRRLEGLAKHMGVDPARLIFTDPVEWEEHVRRGGLADLFLDTLSYNAHSTGCNSLWAGVPLLTYSGEKMASRVAAGMNRALGVPHFTARTPEEYEDLAVAYHHARRGLGKRLQGDLKAKRQSEALFDTEGMVEAMERGLDMAWDVWHDGERYMHIVPADKYSGPAGSHDRRNADFPSLS